MTHDEILTALRNGSRIRWLAKSIIYNEVIGVDSRFICVDGKILFGHEEKETGLNLQDLLTQRILRKRSNEDYTITEYYLRKES